VSSEETTRNHPLSALHTITAMLGIFVLFFALALFFAVRPAISTRLSCRLKKGMSKETVVAILGEPNLTHGNDSWLYWRWGNTGWFEIQFNESECIEYVNDESAFPRK